MKYKRVLLKLSGESLMGDKQFGIDNNRLCKYAEEIKHIAKKNIQIGIVIGGGNIFRGIRASRENNFDRVQGDYMGMLATMINSMALQTELEKNGLQVHLLSAIMMKPICELFSRKKAVCYLEKGRVVIFGAGTGNPYFTTDTAASLRAIEIGADVILKGTRVDGIYSADPEKDRTAVKFNVISFDEVYKRGLQIMDLTAFTLCRENNMPIIVFDINKSGNLNRIIQGKQVGTLVKI